MLLSSLLFCYITLKYIKSGDIEFFWQELKQKLRTVLCIDRSLQSLLLWGTKHQQYENLVFFKHRIVLRIRQKMINSCLSWICHSYFQNTWTISGIDDFPCDQEMWIKIGNLLPQTQRKKLYSVESRILVILRTFHT